jgi:hypothetical protein
VTTTSPTVERAAAGITLLTLAAGQFVMTLDSSVMNVSIATVAADVGTDVTGIQTAITLYTLVMASLMITGGKIGAILGRKKAFLIGCMIYAAGSLITALSQSLPMLLFGWSLLEGIGAALILPAIVALVASNFAASERPRAYGLVAASGAIAVAAGPLIGGLATTYWSWRSRVRRRGVAGRRHRRVLEADGGRAPRPGVEARHRRDIPLGARPGPGGVRRAALGHLGRPASEAGCPRVARAVAGAVVAPRRRRVLVGFFSWQDHLSRSVGNPCSIRRSSGSAGCAPA